MKIAALIYGILGSVLLFSVGAMWTDDAKHLKEAEDAVAAMKSAAQNVGQLVNKDLSSDPKIQEVMNQLEIARGHARSAWTMVACGFVAFIASFFVFKFPKVSGAIMALAVLIPAVLYLGSLIASCLLVLGAIFALLAKRKVATVPATTASA